ncbi:MAG TPA: peptidyl-prolyl cis-trans isomerase [Phycisphaeraceae bacterium]|nr:peptidyl-prolyl cis-trans isomerase [Phycisphaeraceae bacterium]
MSFSNVLAGLLFCFTLLISGCASPSASDKAAAEPVKVLMETSMGNIVLELDPEHAPVTVENFLAYADSGFYDGTIIHRVVPGFVIQGGGHDVNMNLKKTSPPIINEWQNGLKNVRGTIAMAREGGQADSATSQFFINLVDNPRLDLPRDGSGYAVFGKVINGMDVVDAIAAVNTTTHGEYENVPVEPVIVKHVRRL